MTGAVALCGWLAAALAGAVALSCRRALAGRMEAVARACHELRGPLTCARLALELTARVGELSAERLRAIDLELRQAALALDDLRGADPPRRLEWVDVRRLVFDSVEARRGAGRLEARWLGGEPWVWGEPMRLGQAIGNLIGNALEHGAGPVRVTGGVDSGLVRIEVSDQGPGLKAPVAELARRARGGRGSRGRGLAIAGAVADAHGGRLATAPTPHGARVVLTLPAPAGVPLRLPGPR
jgi:signal transduction histidine kinase